MARLLSNHAGQKKVTFLAKEMSQRSSIYKDKLLKSEHTFDAKFTSISTATREGLEKTVRETNAYADKILGLLDQLEEVHLRKHKALQIMKEHSDINKEMFGSLFSAYSALLDESTHRKQVIQVGENAIQTQSIRMKKSRKDVMDAAKRRLDEGRDKQQLAMDASELMKHYKALIMAA